MNLPLLVSGKSVSEIAGSIEKELADIAVNDLKIRITILNRRELESYVERLGKRSNERKPNYYEQIRKMLDDETKTWFGFCTSQNDLQPKGNREKK